MNMESIMNADIFFFITAIAEVILTILIAIILFYIIQILANFRAISDILRNGTENAEEHIETLGKNLAKNPFFKMFFGKKKTTKNTKSKN